VLPVEASRDEVSEAGIFAAEGNEPMLEKVRATLEDLLVACERSGTWQADRASGLVGRVLDQLERDGLAKQTPEHPGGHWKLPELDDDARRRWLELDLMAEMAWCVGWAIDWRAPDDDRIGYLKREAEVTFNFLDPFAAAQRWLDEHWDPEVQPVA
jgi:hypothetical protein